MFVILDQHDLNDLFNQMKFNKLYSNSYFYFIVIFGEFRNSHTFYGNPKIYSKK